MKTVVYKPRRGAPEETNPTSILDFQPPELWDDNILLFEAPDLCYFIP